MFKLSIALIVLSASVASSASLLDKLHDNEFISNLHSQVTKTGAELDSKLTGAAGAQVDSLHQSVSQVAGKVGDKIGSVVNKQDAADLQDALMSRTDDLHQALFGPKKAAPVEPEDPVEGDFGLFRRRRSIIDDIRRHHYIKHHRNVIYPTVDRYAQLGKSAIASGAAASASVASN